MFNML